MGTVPVFLEKCFTVIELSKAWGMSSATVRRIFLDEAGVLKHGKGTRRVGRRYRRRYQVLRIPESVAQRVWDRMINGDSPREK